MKVTIAAEKRYGFDTKRFTFETTQEVLMMTYDGSTPSSDSYDDNMREVEVNADEFKRSIKLIAEVPSLEASVQMLRDNWNTYVNGHVVVRKHEDNISLEIDNDEYLFDEDELVALISAIS